jgi:hypothetical protein
MYGLRSPSRGAYLLGASKSSGVSRTPADWCARCASRPHARVSSGTSSMRPLSKAPIFMTVSNDPIPATSTTRRHWYGSTEMHMTTHEAVIAGAGSTRDDVRFGHQYAPARLGCYDPEIFLHSVSAVFFSEAIGMFPAAVKHAFWAFLSAALTFALSEVSLSQACSAVDRAVAFLICLVASRHFCLAAASRSWRPRPLWSMNCSNYRTHSGRSRQGRQGRAGAAAADDG